MENNFMQMLKAFNDIFPEFNTGSLTTKEYDIKINSDGSIVLTPKETEKSNPKQKDDQIEKDIIKFFEDIQNIPEDIFAPAVKELKEKNSKVFDFLVALYEEYISDEGITSLTSKKDFDEAVNLFNQYIKDKALDKIGRIENQIDDLYSEINDIKATYRVCED